MANFSAKKSDIIENNLTRFIQTPFFFISGKLVTHDGAFGQVAALGMILCIHFILCNQRCILFGQLTNRSVLINKGLLVIAILRKNVSRNASHVTKSMK